jgi:hypothetical protein
MLMMILFLMVLMIMAMMIMPSLQRQVQQPAAAAAAAAAVATERVLHQSDYWHTTYRTHQASVQLPRMVAAAVVSHCICCL